MIHGARGVSYECVGSFTIPYASVLEKTAFKTSKASYSRHDEKIRSKKKNIMDAKFQTMECLLSQYLDQSSTSSSVPIYSLTSKVVQLQIKVS